MDVLGAFDAELRGRVRAALSEMGVEDPVVETETPPDAELGDLAVPCHRYAAALSRDPTGIADDVAGAIEAHPPIGRVAAQGPYVNVHVDPDWLCRETVEAVRAEADDYGSLEPRDRHVILEHTSANPTGPFHVGRARNPIVGDSLARILEAAGWDVQTEYYVNDVGKQAAILAYGLETIDEADLEPPDRDKADHRLVRIYRAANALLEEDPEAEQAVQSILQALERGDEARLAQVREAAEQVLSGMRETLHRTGVDVDGWVWESSFIRDRSVERVIDALKATDHAEQEPDGAWYLDLEPFGLEDERFVFTRADGTSLYTTRDVAYHQDKLERVGAGGRLVTVLGEDHKLQARMLAVALSLILEDATLTDDGLETADGTTYSPIFYAFVSLPEGKMSTRAGRVVSFDDLLDEAVDRARAEVVERRDDLPDSKVAEIAEQVGVGAVRFNIVDVQPEKAMTFRWEEALSFEGDAAPFVQYAHARCAGILRKAGEVPDDADPSLLPDDALPLVKTLARMPSVIDKAARELKPHLVSGYALEVARAFNGFYRDVPVLQAGTAKDRRARLAVVAATRQVLANALGLVGVGAPMEM